jgi:hypothetical protein
MTALYICDIDGTVADGKHRIHLLENKEYDAYYALTLQDKPIDNVIKTILFLMQGGADVWFFSGRKETCKTDTQEWLQSNLHITVPDHELVMRRYNDFRDDVEVKQEMLDNMLDIDRERLIGVFDDRQRVVDMWRRNGITCFQVAPGDF